MFADELHARQQPFHEHLFDNANDASVIIVIPYNGKIMNTGTRDQLLADIA
ncbi:hypothetical protein [Janthinobacterium agaricidamnosum]|nr:hypothetical protein [Janthinobacterium agaricidamnosum]